MELGQHLDETGLNQVYTIYTWGLYGFGSCLGMV